MSLTPPDRAFGDVYREGGRPRQGERATEARRNIEHFLAFSAGMGLLFWLAGLAG